MNIKQTRDQAVAQTMQSIRDIEKEMGVNYPALKRMRTEMISLTANRELFPPEDFPLDPTGRDVIYCLSEDNDHRFTLYGSVGGEGKSVSPHNHTTWAVIVGVYGDEVNQFYQCTSGGKGPGPATLEQTGSFTVCHGNGVVFMPDDIHAIQTDDAVPTLHLHVYGLALDQLSDRLMFDTAAGTCARMPLMRGFISA